MEHITRSTERKINETADKLHEGVDKARRQGVDMVEKSFPNADEAIEKAKAKGEAVWDRAKTKSRDILGDVQSSGQQAWEQTKSFVQKKPVQALGYAILIGVAIGTFLIPKGRD